MNVRCVVIPLHSPFLCHLARSNPNFTRYFDEVSRADVSGLDEASTYSFFINVYNAFAINMVIKNPCKKSLFRLVCVIEPPFKTWLNSKPSM